MIDYSSPLTLGRFRVNEEFKSVKRVTTDWKKFSAFFQSESLICRNITRGSSSNLCSGHDVPPAVLREHRADNMQRLLKWFLSRSSHKGHNARSGSVRPDRFGLCKQISSGLGDKNGYAICHVVHVCIFYLLCAERVVSSVY